MCMSCIRCICVKSPLRVTNDNDNNNYSHTIRRHLFFSRNKTNVSPLIRVRKSSFLLFLSRNSLSECFLYVHTLRPNRPIISFSRSLSFLFFFPLSLSLIHSHIFSLALSLSLFLTLIFILLVLVVVVVVVFF